MLNDLARWGAPADVQRAWAEAASAEPAAFGVWPQNWQVVRAFVAASTQLRVVGTMDRLMFLGFDYAGVRAGLKAEGIKLSKSEWRDFRLMESTARDELNRGSM